MQANKFLICPFMVQAHVEPMVPLQRVGEPLPTYTYNNVQDALLVQETQQVAAARAARDNTMRALRISEAGFDHGQLNSPRDKDWLLARTLLQDVLPTADVSGAMYMLRDQTQYHVDTHGPVYKPVVAFADVYTRSEEGLLYRAETVLDGVKTALTRRSRSDDGVTLCQDTPDCVARRNENGTTSHVPLRGYVFGNRNVPTEGYMFGGQDTEAGERVRFDHYPSCEVFLAAAALEQIELSDTIVRIFNYGIRNREYAARTLVRVMGHEQAPIESVSVSDSGAINKIFSWHTNKTRSQQVRGLVRLAAT